MFRSQPLGWGVEASELLFAKLAPWGALVDGYSFVPGAGLDLLHLTRGDEGWSVLGRRVAATFAPTLLVRYETSPAGFSDITIFEEDRRRPAIVADFDVDGNADLLVADDPGDGHQIRWGRPDGNFDAPQPVEGTPPVALHFAADFDADQRLDLVSQFDDGTIRLWHLDPC